VGRLIAIGDIHGGIDKLKGLMEQIAASEDDRLVFLGDYIDRGSHSYEVVEYLIQFKEDHPHTITLRGNHEDFVISLFMGNMNPVERGIWLNRNGGILTLGSYKKVGQNMSVHRDFYMSLNHSWETEEYFFCHAGVRPNTQLDKQRKIDLLEMDEPFLSSTKSFDKIIVHGHTVVDKPVILPNRIGIDTGAGLWGPLTAIELPSNRIWQAF
jgi:serine/threonine protein phosphatase 1